MQSPHRSANARTNVNWVKRIQLPYLTLSGKTCYFMGLIAVALWVKLEQRALLMFGGLLFLGVGAGLLITWLRVRGLEVSVHRPGVARAFEPSPVEVQVEAPHWVRGLLVLDPRRPILGATLHLERIPPGKPTRGRGFETFTRRGTVRAGPLAFSCSRPFGLAAADRWYGNPTELLVLPPLGELAGPLRDLGWQGRRDEQRPVAARGAGAETLYLRQWEPGDSMRRIHWRASARTGNLMAREFEDERGGLLVIGVGGRHDGSAVQRRLIEAAVSLTATILHQARRRHRDALLVVPGLAEPVYVASGSPSALRHAEEALARLDGDPGWPDWSTIPDSAVGCATVLVHPGSGATPTAPEGAEHIDVEEAVRRGWFRARGGFAP